MYTITCDIKYIDGNLSGLLIPDGYKVTAPDYHSLSRTVAWITNTRDRHDPVIACVTGNKYKFIGPVKAKES